MSETHVPSEVNALFKELPSFKPKSSNIMTILYKYVLLGYPYTEWRYFTLSSLFLYWEVGHEASHFVASKPSEVFSFSSTERIVGTICLSEVIKRLREVVKKNLDFGGYVNNLEACRKHLNYLEGSIKTIQRFYMKRHHARKSDAIFIQYVWRRSFYVPSYKVCQNRIQNWK